MSDNLPPSPWDEKPLEKADDSNATLNSQEENSKETSQKTEGLVSMERPLLEEEMGNKGLPVKVTTKADRKKKLIKIAFIISPIVIVFLLLGVLAMVFGWDKGIIKSSVAGSVTDTKGQAVINALVTIGGKTTNTDTAGKYRIDNLTYGVQKVLIKALDFQDLNSEVVLSRGENTNRDFKLTLVDYSYIQGKLVGLEEKSLDQILLTLNEQVITINEDGSFQSGKLELGNATLKLTTPEFKDITQVVELKEGRNSVGEIVLIKANDVTLSFEDYLSANKIKDVKFKYGDTEYTSNQEGKVVLKDVPVDSNVDTKIILKGYLDKVLTQSGSLTSATVKLVPVGRIGYSSDRSGQDKIYSANYDGSDEKLIYDLAYPLNYNSETDGSNMYFSFKKPTDDFTQYYKVSLSSGKAELIGKMLDKYESGITRDFSFMGNKEIKYQSYYTYNSINYPISPDWEVSIKSRKLSDDLNTYKTIFSEKVIFEGKVKSSFDKIITSVDGSLITYSMKTCDYPAFTNCKENVYIQSSNENNRKSILTFDDSSDIYYESVGFTKDNKSYIYFKYNNVNSTSNIYSYNIQTAETKEYKDSGLSSYTANLSTYSNHLYELLSRDSKTDLYRYSLDSKKLEKITGLGKVSRYQLYNNDIVIFKSDEKLYITKIGGSVTNELNVSTNFGMMYTKNGYCYDCGYD